MHSSQHPSNGRSSASGERTFGQDERSGIHVDFGFYASALRSYGSTNALSHGKRMHLHMLKDGLVRNLFLANLLVQMYGNCGALDDARAVFAKMHQKDAFSWNFLITAYARHGYREETFGVIEQMQQEGVVIDEFIFVSILRVCASPAAMAEGRRIHARIMCCMCNCDVVLRTALINMYSKCGSVHDARGVFDRKQERDVVFWTAMIAAYAQHGQYREAVQLFEQMQGDGMLPDKFIIVSILSACACQAALSEGLRMHDHIRDSKFEFDILVGTALVSMYGKCGSLENAQSIFGKMPERNTVTWNTIIAVNAQHGLDGDAVRLFEQMECEAILPDMVTHVNLLGACATLATEGRRIHARVAGSGIDSDVIVGTAVVTMYGRCGNLEDAWKMLEKMPERNVVSWNAMIAAYAHHRKAQEVLALVEQMLGERIMPNNVTFTNILDACTRQANLATGQWVHSWIMGTGFELEVGVGTAIVNMYGKCGSLDDAKRVFDKMPERNIATFVRILSACGNQAALAEGKQVHAYIIGCRFNSDMVVGTALINMYGKCGSLEDAQRQFESMPNQDLVLWNTLISVYAQNGEGHAALQLFEKMRNIGLIPNEVTYVSILSACSHTGLVEDGCCYFLSMKYDYCITPIIYHFNCMIDLLGRAGRLDEVEELIRNMPIKPNMVSWLALLGACQYPVDTNRAKCVAKHASELDPGDAASYVLLSNTYSIAGNGVMPVSCEEKV